MQAVQRIVPLSPRLTAVLAIVCLGIGLLAGVDPEYGLLAALGLMFTVVTVISLTAGFFLFTVASFLDVISTSGSFSGTKALGLVLFLSWLARMGTRRGADLGQFVSENPMLAAALLAFLAWTAMSFAWAFDGSTALGGAGRLALDLILVPIAYSAARKREHVRWLVAAFVIGALMSGAYGLVSSTASGMDAGRLTGTLGESNAEGTVLAAAIPLLIALYGVISHSARLKLAALIGIVLLFAGLVSTLSREGLVSLGAVLVGAVIFGGRWRGRAAVLLVVGVTAIVGYYAFLAPASSAQRVTMSDTSGRSSLWTVAWRVIEAHPLLGVGNDNFVEVSRRYINQPGQIEAFYIVSQPKVAHNTFLEAAADLGIPGLLMLLTVLWFLLAAAVRAAWIFERLGDDQMELIARGVFLATLAVLASDVFVSGNYAKYQWLVFALCPVVLAAAHRAERRSAAELSAAPHA